MRFPNLLHRFRFSLATLLVASSVIAVPLAWLGWQRQIAAERQAVKQWVYAQGGRGLTMCGSEYFSWRDEHPEPNWARRMFGDVEFGMGVMIPACTPDERARFERAFPESRLVTNADFRRRNNELLRAAGRAPLPLTQ